MRRIKLTQTAILARAISDCNASIRDAEAMMEELAKKKADIEAAFFHEQILRPLVEERETLCLLYEIETGRPYETAE